MSAFDDATPRQQDILSQLSRQLGYNVNELTNVTYTDNIPTEVNFQNAQGTFTRSLLPVLGGVITDAEEQVLRITRAANIQPILQSTAQPNNGDPGINVFNAVGTINQRLQDINNLVRRTPGSITNVIENRLGASDLPPGAVISRVADRPTVTRFPSVKKDMRVKISDPSGRISRVGGALAPLERTDFKVVFPYTPEISLTHSANYSEQNPTHSNYSYLFYQNSTVNDITILATFSARNAIDADYVLAVQHFFRSVTKMFYGQDDIAGLPPVVCRLEGHGDLQFGYIPIVITGFTSQLPSDVDYISASDPSAGRVPTMQTMTINARPLYSRSNITNNFSLTEFARGRLLGDSRSGQGGFI